MSKKIWINESATNSNFYTISLQTQGPKREVFVREISFPENPTPEHPLKHSTVIGLFDLEELEDLHLQIGLLLSNKGE